MKLIAMFVVLLALGLRVAEANTTNSSSCTTDTAYYDDKDNLRFESMVGTCLEPAPDAVSCMNFGTASVDIYNTKDCHGQCKNNMALNTSILYSRDWIETSNGQDTFVLNIHCQCRNETSNQNFSLCADQAIYHDTPTPPLEVCRDDFPLVATCQESFPWTVTTSCGYLNGCTFCTCQALSSTNTNQTAVTVCSNCPGTRTPTSAPNIDSSSAATTSINVARVIITMGLFVSVMALF